MVLVRFIARSAWTTALAMLILFGLAVLGGLAFRLTLPGAIGLYFVMWWLLLFIVLPLSVQSQAEAGDVVAGSDPGAPVMPAMRERAILTTLLSTIVFVIVAALFPLAGL